MALFDQLPRSANAMASGEARILSIDRKKLFTTISRDPTLVFKILESMSRRIRSLNTEIAKLRNMETGIMKMNFDVDETGRMVLEEAKHLVQTENGSLMLLDDDGETLAIRAAFGSQSEKKAVLKTGVGIAGDVVRTGRAELINNVKLDSRFIDSETQINSLLCIPSSAKTMSLG